MKIAIFTDSFLPGIGGTENAIKNFADELSKNNEVLICAPSYSKKEDDSKFCFKVIRAKSIKFSSNDFWAMPDISKNLKNKLKEFSPDIIHCETMGMMAGFANKYAKKHNIPLFYTIHTDFRYCYKQVLKFNFLAMLVLKFVLQRAKKADKVFTVSYSMQKKLIDYGFKKEVSVIKNGGFYVPSQLTKPQNDKLNLLYVGMIIDYKNIEFSLKALKQLKTKTDNFEFTLVGKGPHINKFKKITKSFGLSENVKFVGPVTNKEKLKSYYNNADLFLFPSVFDNDGLVLMEAANHKTPALVLEHSGPSERLVNDETGFICSNNTNDYSMKIFELMCNRKLLKAVGENSYKIITTWEKNVEQYKEFYIQEILKRNLIEKTEIKINNKSVKKYFKKKKATKVAE